MSDKAWRLVAQRRHRNGGMAHLWRIAISAAGGGWRIWRPARQLNVFVQRYHLRSSSGKTRWHVMKNKSL